MNTPKFLIKIQYVNGNCLGKQLVSILEVLNPLFKPTWYVADVEINGPMHFKFGLEGWIPKRLGNTLEVIKLAQGVDQFLSGVFFALPMDVGPTWNREFATEDDLFRDLEEAILEIRAFDTSYFEIYTSDLQIIETLQKYFPNESVLLEKGNAASS